VSYSGFVDNLVTVWAKSEASPFDSKLLDKALLRSLKFEPICPTPSWSARTTRVAPVSSEPNRRVRPLALPN
jgi:hypothetical protein